MNTHQPDWLTHKIVICIPLTLKTKEEITQTVAKHYGKQYLFLEEVFYEPQTNESCLINICDRDELNFDLINGFQSEEANCLSLNTLEQLQNCQKIIYLFSHNLGYRACLKMAQYAQVFLDIGGIALKIDSTGIIHQPNNWLTNYNSEDVFDIYSLFVTLIQGDSFYYSCGMKNFGKADVSLDSNENLKLAVYVMNTFNYYRLTEPAILKDQQTFQPDLESPMYRMQWSEYQDYKNNDILYNPYGKWHLSRIKDNLDISYQIS